MESKKYALITGATSGIGYELAKLFAADGWNLVIVARGQKALDDVSAELMQQYAVDVKSIAKDLFEAENAEDVYQEVKSIGIDIEVLVNDAGQGLYGEFVNTNINRELSIIRLNIDSLVILTKYFLKDMVQRGSGKILNVASVASKVPGPLQSVYHGTKAFVHSFTEAIRSEVKDKGIVVTSLLPGATDTDFFNKADMLDAKNVQEGKLARPADVAKDGYKALMDGDDMVVSGFNNKMQVAMSNFLPDEKVADRVHQQQAPTSDSKK